MTEPPLPDPHAALNQPLAALRADRFGDRPLDEAGLPAGLALRADPGLDLGGLCRSPAGRLLELEVTARGQGDWIALHVALDAPDLSAAAYVGFACRSAAPEQHMIRACLRSGAETGDGFSDCFFDRHILAHPEPANHVDALHAATCRDLPETAPWRELVLFLPTRDFTWHLHDLRLFVL